MKIIKTSLIVLVVLLGVILLVALFLPTGFEVERQIEINAPVDSVFKLVENVETLLKWNPWSRLDPAAENTLSDSLNGVGAYWYWNGAVIGQGSMTISDIDLNKRITYALRFDKPKMNPSEIIFHFQSTSMGTRVGWINRGHLNYPIGRYFGLLMDGMLGKDFEKGLRNLKELAENK